VVVIVGVVYLELEIILCRLVRFAEETTVYRWLCVPEPKLLITEECKFLPPIIIAEKDEVIMPKTTVEYCAFFVISLLFV